MSTRSQFQRLRLLRTMITSHELHIPSTKVASPNVDSTMTLARGGGLGSRSSAEWASPLAGALVSSLPHDRSVDFLHQDVAESATQHWSSTQLLASSERTYRVDRTTVTVGASRMQEISTMPAFVAASSSA
jgi:hypothetical protein